MEFEYRNLNGVILKAKFSDLVVIANGPIELSHGWKSDRINFHKPLSIFIEFRSGPEIYPPGIELTDTIEVTKEYIKKIYGISV